MYVFFSFFSHRCAYVKEEKVESSRSIPRLRSAWKCDGKVENNRFRIVAVSWTRARVCVCFEMTTTTTSSWGVPETSPAYTTGYRKFLWLYHIVKVITPIYLTVRKISSSDAHTPPRSCGAHTSPLASVISPPRERRRLAVVASHTLVVVVAAAASRTPDTVVVVAAAA